VLARVEVDQVAGDVPNAFLREEHVDAAGVRGSGGGVELHGLAVSGLQDCKMRQICASVSGLQVLHVAAPPILRILQT
jgi:hypothetical protein